MSDEGAAPKQNRPPIGKPFLPGNPGRPKGSRDKIAQHFIKALAEDFEEHGAAVIATVRTKRPHEYLKLVASLLPKVVEIKDNAFEGIDDAELAALIAAARTALGVSQSGGNGSQDEGQSEPPGGVSSLH